MAVDDGSADGPLRDVARAKINLTLGVLGRRPDGYHELDSLVAFAGGDASDVVALAPGGPLRLEVSGAGAAALTEAAPNLVIRAAEAALRGCEALSVGTFRLEKRLPIAAGLGGGSADAAAALRLIRRLNPSLAGRLDWPAIAATVGADVPVCLGSRAAMMRGIGERVAELPQLPEMWVVLANPGVALATAAVFKDLASRPVEPQPSLRDVPRFASRDDLIRYVRAGRNDLEATAEKICPAIGRVRAVLEQLPGAILARMSGSGPTVFALFADGSEAGEGARRLRREQPGWWVEAAPLF